MTRYGSHKFKASVGNRKNLTVPVRVYEALLSVVNALLEQAQRCPSWFAGVQGGRCPFHTERHRPELSAQNVIARGNENPAKSGILAKKSVRISGGRAISHQNSEFAH